MRAALLTYCRHCRHVHCGRAPVRYAAMAAQPSACNSVKAITSTSTHLSEITVMSLTPYLTGCASVLQLGDQVGSCQSNPIIRSIVIQITDQCPQCEPDHLDVQALTWAKVCPGAACRFDCQVMAERSLQWA